MIRWLLGFMALVCTTHLQAQISSSQISADVEELSSDAYGGRKTGEPGNEKARTYILNQLKSLNLEPAYAHAVDTFRFLDFLKNQRTGYNIAYQVTGTKYSDRYIVVTAHYDHIGTKDGQVYNGADDNASGTSSLLALAKHYAQFEPNHSIIFVWYDAEELGLEGADRFVEDPPVDRDQLLINYNMDMVGRNDNNTINICGAYYFPKLSKIIKQARNTTDLRITTMHEGPDFKGSDNWTLASDHGEFHKRRIPYFYYGVEDHPGYHQPSDDFEFINADFHFQVTKLVRTMIDLVDTSWKGKRRGKMKNQPKPK